MIVYLVEADFGQYDDVYKVTISLRSKLQDAEEDKLWYEKYIKNILDSCPFTNEQLEIYENELLTPVARFTDEQYEAYNEWVDVNNRILEFNFVKITSIEMDKRLIKLGE